MSRSGPAGALDGSVRVEAVRIPTGTLLHPWDTPVGALPVLEHTLAAAQDHALAEVGARRVAVPSGTHPVLLFTDRQWFTGPALARLLAGDPGRLRVDDAEWWATCGSLHDVPAAGVMELGWTHPGPALDDPERALAALPVRSVELGLEPHGTETTHPRLRHAHRPLRVGAAAVHLLQHWTHLVRVNQLAIQAEAYAARDRFQAATGWRRWAQGLRMVWRAGGVSEDRLAAALVTHGPGCRIHPSAVVEASRLGAGVQVGPQAVVRGSVLQDGVHVDEHATVVASVVAAGARLGPYGHLRYCTVFPGARISAGPGYQLSAFGADSFVAWGVAALDLRFGRTIRTEVAPGVEADTGHHFLGCAVGHRAVVGQGVRLAPGAVVPCDATLVDPDTALYRRWGPLERTLDAVRPTRQGVARATGSADGARGRTEGLGVRREDALLGDDAVDEAGGRDIEGEVSGG